MAEFNIITAVKELGYPIAISLYLLYLNNSQSKTYGKKLDEIKNILVNIATQYGALITSNIAYKSGNTNMGDTLSKQAADIGEKMKAEQDGLSKKAGESK
jgi:hypothetical protein